MEGIELNTFAGKEKNEEKASFVEQQDRTSIGTNNKYKKFLLIGVIILGLLLLICKVVYVFDGSIVNPAKDLRLTKYYTGFLSENCGLHSDENKSFVFINKRSKCPHYLVNENYIIGPEMLSSVSPISAIDISKAYLRPIAIYTELRFQDQGEERGSRELDVLKLIELYSNNTLPNIETLYSTQVFNSTDPDFKIENEKTQFGFNPENWIIHFTGLGGIQKASSLKPIIAPEDGYEKDIELEHDTLYVARLKDGKHYMLLKLWARNGYSDLIDDSPNLQLYISPIEGRKLNFDLSNSNFYYGTKESGTYGEQFYNFRFVKDTFFPQ